MSFETRSSLDIGFRLDGLEFGKDLVLTDLVAFLHIQLEDSTHDVGADVDIIPGLDFTRRGNKAGQVLADGAPGLDVDDAAVLHLDAGDNAAGDDKHSANGEDPLPLTLHFG